MPLFIVIRQMPGLVDEFGKKVEYIIKEIESGKDAAEISIEELKNKPKYTKEQIKEALYAGTYTGAKRFLEQIRRTGETNTTTDTGLAETISSKKTDDTGFYAVGRLDDGRRDRRICESSSGDIGVNEDSGIRFSVAEYSEEDKRDIIGMLRGVVKLNALEEDAFYGEYLRSKGVKYSFAVVRTCQEYRNNVTVI